MKKQIEDVKEFHVMTENNWQATPKIPSKERLDLRVHLIMEEAHEFEQAVKDRDLTEMADALADLLYVTFGSLGELGLESIAEELLAEVHRSNMSKACKTIQQVRETIHWYRNRKDANQCEADFKAKPDGSFLVFRISDGKTLKSKFYSPADLKSIIRKATLA